jgi:hypothetical protein
VGKRDVSVSIAGQTYSMYGVRVTSDIPFDFPGSLGSDAGRTLAEVSFVEGEEDDFAPWAAASTGAGTFLFDEAADGRCYLRWPHLYEFVVASDGTSIACRPLDGSDVSVLQNFLFGQVLGVALVRQGLEPLHAATVVMDDAAVAFIGDCTYGKSTLLASFADAGYRALTDDMLILDRRWAALYAMPGTGRVKLQPDSAPLFFDRGSGAPLTPNTRKRSFELGGSKHHRTSAPLRLLYLLPSPAERDNTDSIEIRQISRAAAVRGLIANTFTSHIVSRERLARQFDHATSIASSVDAFELRYPTGLEYLPEIRRAIVEQAQHCLAQHTSTTESL